MAKAKAAKAEIVEVARPELDPTYLGPVSYMLRADRVNKDNCKLCKFKNRDDIEDYFQRQRRKNYSEIQRKLKADYDFDISVTAVRNHMLYHFRAIQVNESINEFAGDIQSWADAQTDTVGSLRAITAVLEREMMALAAEADELEPSDRRRNAETVKKLAETVLTYRTKMEELSEGAKPVMLMYNQIKVIVSDQVAHARTEETKKAFVEFLRKLKTSVGDLKLE